MAEVTISREAVDAGARAIYEGSVAVYGGKMPAWDAVPDMVKHDYREAAAAVLNASAQLIVAAELDRMASLLRVQARLCPCTKGGEWQPGPNCINRAHANTVQRIEEYGTRAAELRAQS